MGTANFFEPTWADKYYTIDYNDYNDEDDEYYDYGDYYYREIEQELFETFIEKMKEKYKKLGCKKVSSGLIDYPFSKRKGQYYIQHDDICLYPKIQYGYYSGALVDFEIEIDGDPLEQTREGEWYIDNGDYYNDYIIKAKQKERIYRLLEHGNAILGELTDAYNCAGRFSNGEAVYVKAN